jgi:hypothetical protein
MSATKRKEGWATVFVDGVQTRKAHFFGADARSLCGKYASLGEPRWEADQETGENWSRDSGTCQTCWFKRKNSEDRAPK